MKRALVLSRVLFICASVILRVTAAGGVGYTRNARIPPWFVKVHIRETILERGTDYEKLYDHYAVNAR
jgi:hypothetical protein